MNPKTKNQNLLLLKKYRITIKQPYSPPPSTINLKILFPCETISICLSTKNNVEISKKKIITYHFQDKSQKLVKVSHICLKIKFKK